MYKLTVLTVLVPLLSGCIFGKAATIEHKVKDIEVDVKPIKVDVNVEVETKPIDPVVVTIAPIQIKVTVEPLQVAIDLVKTKIWQVGDVRYVAVTFAGEIISCIAVDMFTVYDDEPTEIKTADKNRDYPYTNEDIIQCQSFERLL